MRLGTKEQARVDRPRPLEVPEDGLAIARVGGAGSELARPFCASLRNAQRNRVGTAWEGEPLSVGRCGRTAARLSRGRENKDCC
eukprot:scaffold95369_cov25-Tisochrysis_lutea.AAC.8